MELKDILFIIIGGLGLLLALWQFLKNLKLQKENIRLQRQSLDFQKEQEAKKELSGAVEHFKVEQTKKTAQETYCEHISQKFKYLDFTAIDAVKSGI